jgi:HSP20 family protein
MATMLPARHEPFRDLSTLREEVERLFRETFGGTGAESPTPAGGWSPDLDIEEDDEAYTMHVELPGVKSDDITVSLEDDVLTIAGERRFYEEKEEEGFRRIERRFGSFRRSLRLPAPVDPDQVDARHVEGVLTVRVPKAPETKPQRIEVTSG